MPKRILITGAAGFIGASLAKSLLEEGNSVVGIDNLNDYYPADLKKSRLAWIGNSRRFYFEKMDVSDASAVAQLVVNGAFDVVVHLAAQAGVRYSIINPLAYGKSNLTGHLAMLEAVRQAKQPPLFVYASSSSVYGNSTSAPYREDQPVDSPVSLYAATKRSCELMSESYGNLYGLKQIGLRFFTVYGPWGRPDMAYWIFTKNILNGEPIKLFNHGDLRRDFTWIGDIISGIRSIIANGAEVLMRAGSPHGIYNLGNSSPTELKDFVGILEDVVGKQAVIEMMPMQTGDVYQTYADTTAAERDFGFAPNTPLRQGLEAFCSWFTVRGYHQF